MRNAHIKYLFGRFKDGRTLVDSDPRSARITTTRTPENVTHVRATSNKNRLLTYKKTLELRKLLFSQESSGCEIRSTVADGRSKGLLSASH